MTRARTTILTVAGAAILGVAAVVAGCGAAAGASDAVSPATSGASPASAPAPSTSAAGSGGQTRPLTGEAAATATGDIPDNQVFLTARNLVAGFTMKYPEGWAQKGTAGNVTFSDKNNIVHVKVSRGPALTVATVTAELAALKQQTPSLQAGTPAAVTVAGHSAIKVTYTSESAPNPVTGKTVKLTVDRYYFWRGGRVAVIDLGTPVGVDNVDAYRMMSESFTWLK